MYISRGRRNLSQKGYEASSAIILPSGSVVYSSRAPIGYVAIVSNDISTNQGFKSFIIPEGIYNKFLYFYLKSIKDIAEQNATGTTFKELSGSAAALLPLVLPPLAEQIRIADKLDALLARVEAGRERLERVPKLLKRFRQSVLSAAVSGELTREWRGGGDAEWAISPLSDLIKKIEQGWSPQCEKEAARENEWAVIKTTAIQHMSFLPHENKKLPSNLDPRAELTLEKGDILITRAGPRIRVGVACLVKQNHAKLILCDKAYRLKIRDDIALPEFLEIALNEPAKISEIDGLKTGISESGVNLTQAKFLNLDVCVPRLNEQAEIVRRVESLLAIADRIEAKYAAALSSFDRLTPALLAKAFRGELVPQDPNDEPASVLLERIRAAREAEGGKRGRGRPAKAAAGSGDGEGVKRRGRPPGANAQAGEEGTEPKRRGRPPKVREVVSEPAGQPAAVPAAVEASAAPRGRGRPPGAGIPQASSFEDALRKLEEQKLARAQGARQVGLFDDAE